MNKSKIRSILFSFCTIFNFSNNSFCFSEAHTKSKFFREKRLQALEKIGFFKGDKNSNKSIWIHAVSVGEVNVALKLIQDLEGILENPNFILSTTTLTGARKAKENLNKNSIHVYFPFDLNLFARNSLIFINLQYSYS